MKPFLFWTGTIAHACKQAEATDHPAIDAKGFHALCGAWMHEKSESRRDFSWDGESVPLRPDFAMFPSDIFCKECESALRRSCDEIT